MRCTNHNTMNERMTLLKIVPLAFDTVVPTCIPVVEAPKKFLF